MMNLEIRKVADNATDEERVVLYALADCNLNDYLLFDSTYDEEGNISNKHRHMFVFPDQNVKKGDFVWIYSKDGNAYKRGNNSNTTTYILFWGLNCHVWNNDGDTVHLIHYDGYVVKNVK